MQVLDDFSLEMTGKDVHGLGVARQLIPAGTRINVTFLGNEDMSMRVRASRTVQQLGFLPVPHISARRLRSPAVLHRFLEELREARAVNRVFVVGGDPREAEGPYESAAQVIATGILPAFGVEEVGIAGYPEGHPHISESNLWQSLEHKTASLQSQGLRGTIVTQFGFDVAAVLSWVDSVRARGIDLPIRVGVPGPAGIKRLLTLAARLGAASSAGIARKYGMSVTNLVGTAGPDRFIADLQAQYDPVRHGHVTLHFYTFGGLSATSKWIRTYQLEAASE